VAPKRAASILDIFSCVVQGIIPHGGQILLCVSLTGLSPFSIIGANYYCFLGYDPVRSGPYQGGKGRHPYVR